VIGYWIGGLICLSRIAVVQDRRKYSPLFFRLSGLGVVYAVNIVLAVIAAFKAPERGQPVPLWVAKTLAVGGIAYDQLTQLPTLDEIEELKNRNGARAPKKGKK
jgi:ABC-type Fe3+-siderophore transport system permease subunit